MLRPFFMDFFQEIFLSVRQGFGILLVRRDLDELL